MVLHNKVNGKELKQQLLESKEARKTYSFYKYAHIKNPSDYRDELYLFFQELGVFGRVYLAKEGINAQLSIPNKNIKKFQRYLNQSPHLVGIQLNEAIDDDGKSFFKLKIQVKQKIVADGLDDNSFDVTNCGTHLEAVEFNKLTDQSDTVLIDMRNHYESEVGHFKNALLPDSDTFKETLNIVKAELKGKEDNNIVMYCTGGIRCEKASAYYKSLGFKNVFQLKGGIIKYARDAGKLNIENKFLGKNFVFDERLGERITKDVISRCHQCGKPCDDHTNCKNYACHLLFIQCTECDEKYQGCCSKECNEIILLPEEKQRSLRKGSKAGSMIYKKGRSEKLLYKSNK